MKTLLPASTNRKVIIITLCLAIAITSGFFYVKNVQAATICWSGGGADNNWSTPGNWKGGSAPGSSDIAEFDSTTDCPIGTYPNANKNVTIDASTTVAGVSFVNYSGLVTHNSSVTLTVSGSVTFLASTYTASADSSAITMTGTGTLTTGGNSMGNFTVNGSGITVTMGDNFTGRSTTQTVTLTQGTLKTDGAADNSGFTHTWGNFSGSNSNTRTLTLGNSSITVTKTTLAWTTDTSTNLTLNPGTSTITVTGANSQIAGGSKTYYNAVLSPSDGQSTQGSGGTTIFNNLTVNGITSKTSTFKLIGGVTVTGTLTIAGNSATNRLLVYSWVLGTSKTITVTGATVTASNVDFTDIKFTPATDLSAISGGSGDGGGNSQITFTTAAPKYWVGNGGSWSDPTNHWATSSGGSPGAANIPLPQDNVAFDANSFSSASQTVTADMPRLGKSIDWTGATNSPTLYTNGNTSIYGSITLISAMTLTTTSGDVITFLGRSSSTLTSSGKQFRGISVRTVDSTLTLLDALSLIGNLTLVQETFDANDFNVTIRSFNSTSVQGVRTLLMGSGTWTVTGTGTVWDVGDTTGVRLTLNAETSTISITDTSSSSKTFNQDTGFTYNNLSIAGGGTGAVTIVGSNTFNTLTIGTPKTITFTNGTTQTITNLVAVGTSSNKITMQSDSGGVAWNLAVKGPEDIAYIILSDSNACSGHSLIANVSTNSGGNSCWSFVTNGSSNPIYILQGTKINAGVKIWKQY